LFKIYKTRIWMSAINPASFVTPPTAGLQGTGAMSNPLYSQDAPSERRHQHDGRSYGRDGADAGHDGVINPGMLRAPFTDSYQPFVQASREETTQPDPFAPYSPTSYTGFDFSGGANSNGARMHPTQNEWVGRFQGLSLNS
jgi:hypothetical protein